MAQMGEVMDAMDRVANVLLGNRGNTYSDSCLAESLTLEGPDNVRQVTSALADSSLFQRRFGTCSMCRRDTLVIVSNCTASQVASKTWIQPGGGVTPQSGRPDGSAF